MNDDRRAPKFANCARFPRGPKQNCPSGQARFGPRVHRRDQFQRRPSSLTNRRITSLWLSPGPALGVKRSTAESLGPRHGTTSGSRPLLHTGAPHPAAAAAEQPESTRRRPPDQPRTGGERQKPPLCAASRMRQGRPVRGASGDRVRSPSARVPVRFPVRKECANCALGQINPAVQTDSSKQSRYTLPPLKFLCNASNKIQIVFIEKPLYIARI